MKIKIKNIQIRISRSFCFSSQTCLRTFSKVEMPYIEFHHWDYLIEAYKDLAESPRNIFKHARFYDELMTFGWEKISKLYIQAAITNEIPQKCLDKFIDALLIGHRQILINVTNMSEMLDLFLACGAKFPMNKVLPPRNKFKKYTEFDVEDYHIRGALIDYLADNELFLIQINGYADWVNVEASYWSEGDRNADLAYLKYCSAYLKRNF